MIIIMMDERIEDGEFYRVYDALGVRCVYGCYATLRFEEECEWWMGGGYDILA